MECMLCFGINFSIVIKLDEVGVQALVAMLLLNTTLKTLKLLGTWFCMCGILANGCLPAARVM